VQGFVTTPEMHIHYAEHVGEMLLPVHVLEAVPSSGPADAAVAQGVDDKWVRAAFEKVSDENLRRCLQETGAWEASDLQDRSLNEQRLLWIAAGDYHEYLCSDAGVDTSEQQEPS
jgi:hypothetical protein